MQRKIGDHSDTELKPDPLIPLQAKIDFSQVSQPLQRREGFGASESNHHVAPPKVNKTGLPDRLKTNIENLSGGIDLSDVKVHRNSSAPEKIGALAYTKGTDIHLGPGQEKHLPHEAWHVVQQKQVRVPVNTQFKGLAGNDDSRLEKEADRMGDKAMRVNAGPERTLTTSKRSHRDSSSDLSTTQRKEGGVTTAQGWNNGQGGVVQCLEERHIPQKKLEDILNDSKWFASLLAFTEKEFASENLLFLNACRIVFPQFGKAPMDSDDFSEGDEEALYSTFISSDAELEVNISYKQKQKIEREHTEDAYQAAYNEIYALTEFDTLSRFKNTDEYKELTAGRFDKIKKHLKNLKGFVKTLFKR